MERLLAKKGIELVSHIDEYGARVSYAFTEEMLKQRIVVVLTEYSSEWYYDYEEGTEEEWDTEEWEAAEEAEEAVEEEDEEAYEEEEWEEGEDAYEEDEEWHGEGGGETTVAVVFTKENVSWDCTICVDERPVVPVIYLYTIIKELTEIIAASDAEGLADDLASISTGVSISSEYEDDSEFSQQIFALAAEHIDKATSLYQEKKAAL